MDGAHVVALDAAEAADASVVGAKAAGLARLARAGFPVPPGLCITTAAYRDAIAPFRTELAALLATPDLSDPAVAGEVARGCAALLSTLAVPDAVAARVVPRLDELVAGSRDRAVYAVRSSATAEDLIDVSFAGQYESYLGLTGSDQVLSAVADCWRSFFGPNALAARAGAGRLDPDEAMAVLVQPVVDAECAGVAYSVDPVRQDPDLIVVEAAWGLGVGTVDGSVPNDVARVYRPTMRLDEHVVVEKGERIGLGEAGGVARLPVDDERRRSACLSEAWLGRLAQFAVAAETLAGRPQDVEWAIAGRRVWLLQTRALTALPESMTEAAPFPVDWSDPDDARRHWTLSINSRSDVPYPFDHDLADAFGRAVDDAIVFGGATFFPPSRVMVVNGRRYATPVPGPHRPGDVRVRTRAMSDLNRRLLQEHGLTAWDHWGPEVVRATERLAERDLAGLGGPALAEHLEDAFAVFRRHWMIHWLLWFPPLDDFLDAHRALIGAERRAEPDALAPLLDGEDTPLTRLIDGIFELGSLARATPAVAEVVRDGAPDAIAQLTAIAEAAPFLDRLERFLREHGDRTGTGYGSSVIVRRPTWREAPERLFELLAPYLDGATEAPAAARERMRRRRDAEVDALCEGKDAELVAEFRHQLALARKDATVLEEHNHYIDQLSTAQLRAAVIAAGRSLERRGALPDAESVYWLGFDEIVSELRRVEADADAAEAVDDAVAADSTGDEAATARLARLVRERRDEHARHSALKPPPVLGVPSAELPPRPPPGDDVTAQRPLDPAVVAGTGASPGRHTGRARVVLDLVAVPKVEPGEVLVAINAGPLWTPVFPILGALVLDHGAVTQHSGATAREYGVPCVVATRNASRRIPDGALVTVDGGAGTVEIHDHERAAAGSALDADGGIDAGASRPA